MTRVPNLPFPTEDWVGKEQLVEDQISLGLVRRAAAMLDMDPAFFQEGSVLPPHWYSMFFAPNARRSEIGHDGHPKKGDFLPPVPLPRRMFVGRSVTFPGVLRVGDRAMKRSTIADITPKVGRSGPLVFLRVNHRIEVGGEAVVIEDQNVVYREAAKAGAVPDKASGSPAPQDAEWSEAELVDPVLLFRFSAITWNGHRIHYDADYARQAEGYPALVMNGALTVHLLIDAVRRQYGFEPAALTARMTKPLFLGSGMTLAGRRTESGEVEAWVADEAGELAAQVTLTLGSRKVPVA